MRFLFRFALVAFCSIPALCLFGAEKPSNREVGENKATPTSRIKAVKDFKVELLYSVPGGEQGSWVNLCVDPKGRIFASDQYGGLYRFTPPAPGEPLDPAKVEKVPAQIRAVNGMLWAFGALYVGVNDYEKKIPSGVYRITDSDNDDMPDKVELLRQFKAGSDHGVHAILPSPDGKSLFLVCGNNADLTPSSSTRVPFHWGEDHLLNRMPDGRGHNRDRLAPGGIIYQFSPDGKDFEVYSSGYRNIFDASFNRDGELFTYDADMEYDFNTPWYRPTRINHVTSGSEYGWRNGAGKFPEFYPDNLPAVHNIGPGSPTGMTFGYGAKFPAKYQNAMFVLDWSWGKLYAIHLQPNGSSYTATREEFLSGAPLPLTDAIIHPGDGAMYFAIGGRKVQSGFYRLTYTGTESTAPVKTGSTANAKERKFRHELEKFHGKQDANALKAAWPHLDHKDRFTRWAARTAIEHQPPTTWAERALTEKNPGRQVEALLALTRVTGIDPQHRKPTDAPADKAMQQKILNALTKLNWKKLNHEQRLTLVRTYQISFVRFGRPDDSTIQRILAQLDPQFPAPTFDLNWLLCETLVYLQSPTVASKAIALIKDAPGQEEQMEYARSLRFLKTGWTPALRTEQFEWFLKAANYRGGASFEKFLEFIRTDAETTLTPDEKAALKTVLAKKPVKKSPLEAMAEALAGRTNMTEWTLETIAPAAERGLKKRNFDNGRKMFGAAGCFACHRFGNEGGMTGPDLTGSGGRYSARDFLDQILNPSKEINEQFVPMIITRNDGETITGVIVNLNGDNVMVNTDPANPFQQEKIDRKLVKSIEVSKFSPMPEGLLDLLTEEEILDLTAYALSGGDRKHPMFR
ncbi:MAG: c-type cytochrome [Verrucomicrobia bacterium]|nr:c-type cytochrome [Verrucomicrobiota bacterium]